MLNKTIDSESSELESSHSSEIQKLPTKRFRVGVSLLRIYGESDPRARCYVAVDPHRRVSWLEQRLRKLLVLTEPFVLRSRGHLLPSAERLTIICTDDPVEVYPITRDLTTNGESVKKSDSHIAVPQSSLDVTDGEKSKRETGLHLNSFHTMEQTESIQETEDSRDLESYKERALAMLVNNCSQVSQSDEQDNTDNIWMMEDFSNANMCTKRKRVRRRKRKNNLLSDCPGDTWENTTSASGRAPRLVEALPGLTAE